MIRGFGGHVRFTPAPLGVEGAIAEPEKLAAEQGAFLPRQFSNPDNARAHELHTARDIDEAQPGVAFDAVVGGVGTGGTLSCLYADLKPHSPNLRPVLARPVEITETVEAECCSFSSKIPGHGGGTFETVPAFRDPGPDHDGNAAGAGDVNSQAIDPAGFPVGPSSGLNYAASAMVAAQLGEGSQAVTVFPDRMERYFNTMLFAPSR